MTGRVQTTIRIPRPLNDWLTAQAEAVGCSRAMLLTSIMEWWYEEHGDDTVTFPLTRPKLPTR